MRHWFIRKFMGDNKMFRQGISGTAIMRFFRCRRSMPIAVLVGVIVLAQAGCGVSYVAKNQLTLGQSFRDELASGGQGPEMVIIPAGRFRMGCVSGRDCDDDETLVHEVTIAQPFALSKYEVTRGEFGRFVAQAGYRTTAERSGGCYGWDGSDDYPTEKSSARWNNPGFNQSDTHPVVCVSWDDAVAYVEWLSSDTGKRYRLSSEAEWEYAARAGTTTEYSWGNDIGRNRANCDGCGSRWDYGQTASVGSFPANGFGLHDMHGNVWEWVQDCWTGSYAGAPSDGSAWEREYCGRRVLRGGSWFNKPRDIRAANRVSDISGYRFSDSGFRVARTLTP